MSADVDRVDVIVVVGTDHHPFDRLVQWIDRWARDRSTGARCLVQHGTSVPPIHARAVDYLPRDDLLAGFADARVVVCHGGPSTIVEALRNDRLPFVVPRSPDHGEHVDGHQERFADVMSRKGLIRLVPDEVTLHAWLDRELAEGPAQVAVNLPPAAAAARELGRRVEALLTGGPTRRLRLLRRSAARRQRAR